MMRLIAERKAFKYNLTDKVKFLEDLGNTWKFSLQCDVICNLPSVQNPLQQRLNLPHFHASSQVSFWGAWSLGLKSWQIHASEHWWKRESMLLWIRETWSIFSHSRPNLDGKISVREAKPKRCIHRGIR